jgi:rubrerythrin
VRLRVGRVALVGTSRAVTLESGLNVVLGDFTTGKTSFMRLLRVLLGSDYDGIIPELQRVSHLSGELLIEDEEISVVRRLSQTNTARVDIAAHDFSGYLPAMKAEGGRESYGSWLIERLGLPRLLVPSAPTKPAESGIQPVSIADYLRYCRLTQKEIVADVLGSSTWFKDYKRRVVFGIYFGTYDEEIAKLQEQLREVESEMRSLRQGTTAFDRFLEGTVLANRAALEAGLAEARRQQQATAKQRAALADQRATLPAAQDLRRRVAAIDEELAELHRRRKSELSSADELAELSRQLRAQSARLTKAVVSSAHFVDFEFRVCPRCGHTVEADRAPEENCILCLQPPSSQVTREDLLVEQVRVEAQIDETDELAEFHRRAADEIVVVERDKRKYRVEVAEDLDDLTRTFVSDRAQRMTQLAAEQADARARVDQFTEYLALFDKADRARSRLDVLEGERAEIERRLSRAEEIDRAAESRIRAFEHEFAAMVERLRLPVFEEGADPRAAIHPGDYQPIVNGRRISEHSGGMAVLINVAYMLALHRMAMEHGLRLPSLLMIDGINQNLGRNEYDSVRYELIWRQLAEFHHLYGDRIQIIVATNDIPSFIEGLDVVRLRLTETDRLVPPADELGEVAADEE